MRFQQFDHLEHLGIGDGPLDLYLSHGFNLAHLVVRSRRVLHYEQLIGVLSFFNFVSLLVGAKGRHLFFGVLE